MCVPDRPSLPGDDPRALCLYSGPGDDPNLDSTSTCSEADRASPSPAMPSTASHWGSLINPDKSPAPLLEQLCLGIAAQLMPSFDSNPTTDLTPDRLAAFYKKVGGNYDPLFLDTKCQSLSFIYQSLGCFHSLQPSKNPYEPPSIPSLCPNGFVRWQTIQLLMDPDEHWRYLQNAVSQWDIVDAKGDIFPKDIPRDAFPSEPDPEMLQWHEGVSRRLEHDYVKRNVQRSSPPSAGSYHYHFSGKDPLPDEEDYFSNPSRHAGSRRHENYDSDRPSRHRSHRRRPSTENHMSSRRRPESAYFARPDGGRSGVTSPRTQSPRPDLPPRSRGRDRAGGFSRPLNPDLEDMPDLEASDHSPRDGHHESKSKYRTRAHNLSPPPNSRARRHSHDAYTRKPARDLSPAAPRRAHVSNSHEPRSSKATNSRREGEGRSRSRHDDVQFREFIFDGPVPAPAPDPPQYTSVPPPRSAHRHWLHMDRYAGDDIRRGSFSGGSPAGSRPESENSSERPRSFSSAGLHPRGARWTSPVRGPVPKRYIPTTLNEDIYDMPSPARRAPLYD
ncbi:hypothetical protein N7462_000114 [Penicillium macrosclerotiorum]|uniref:uncharacterized protein n=1 Tax=Penicillium macrosclerotiorum TaxID=303699 RepID=UPI002548DF34|nr:uncharacterized protein N7462_000114 [Penicillium macrosclerotiorum]KAJ5698109.1 hypothetical protein N7462_000114 [Penicillium macrosclerotiorum]